jgi:predicted nucleic acid-binding protein
MPPFTTKPEKIRAVFDTNIIIAAHLTKNPQSPTRELLERWRNKEFELAYSTALLVEYQEKFMEKIPLFF